MGKSGEKGIDLSHVFCKFFYFDVCIIFKNHFFMWQTYFINFGAIQEWEFFYIFAWQEGGDPVPYPTTGEPG